MSIKKLIKRFKTERKFIHSIRSTGPDDFDPSDSVIECIYDARKGANYVFTIEDSGLTVGNVEEVMKNSHFSEFDDDTEITGIVVFMKRK